VLDVGAGGFGYTKPVQREQRDQRMLERRGEPGGDQERAELVAVQSDGMRLVIQTRPADVRGRRMLQELLFDRLPVEPGDGGQPPGDSRAGPARTSSSLAKLSTSARRTANSGRERVRHHVVN
jgi:hypothetical protein